MGRPSVIHKKICYCCDTRQSRRFHLNEPTDLVLCHTCTKWLYRKRRTARITHRPKIYECYACGLQSIIIFNPFCITRWWVNRNHCGFPIGYLCMACDHLFIRSKRKYPIGKYTKNKEQNPFWKGGITDLQHKIRECDKYKEWQLDVLVRDKFKCQKCEETEPLNTHHVKAVADIIFQYGLKTIDDAHECIELWNTNNGQTLCQIHHKDTESYLWKSSKKYRGNV